MPRASYGQRPGDFVMTFGAHKGKPIYRLPEPYLGWLVSKGSAIRNPVKRNLDQYIIETYGCLDNAPQPHSDDEMGRQEPRGGHERRRGVNAQDGVVRGRTEAPRGSGAVKTPLTVVPRCVDCRYYEPGTGTEGVCNSEAVAGMTGNIEFMEVEEHFGCVFGIPR